MRDPRPPPAPDARPLLSKVVPGDSRHWYSWVKYFFRLVVTVTGCWQCARMGGTVHRPFSPEWLLGFINSNLFRGRGRGRGAKSFMCIKFLAEGRGRNWIAVTGEAQRQQNEEKQNSRSLGFSVRALDAWNLLCLHSLWRVGPNLPKVSSRLGAATSSSSSSISWEQIANSKSVKTAEINAPHKQSAGATTHNARIKLRVKVFQTCIRRRPAAALLRGPLHPAAMKSCKVKIIKKKGELLR